MNPDGILTAFVSGAEDGGQRAGTELGVGDGQNVGLQ